MLIECLIQRDGDTEIRLALSYYKFKKNKTGHAVCDVGNKQHSDYLLGLGDFKEYKEGVVTTDEIPPQGLPTIDEQIKGLWMAGERSNKVIANKVESIPITVSQKIRKMGLK